MKKQKMYKITLFDANCPSCTSGVISYFTDDIDEFKSKWMKLETDEQTKERFLRSLGGEIVTDYYSDDPKLNIVQLDESCKILGEKELELSNKTIELENSYGWTSNYYIHNLKVLRKYIEFQDELYRIDKFIIRGIARENELNPCIGKYTGATCYGNKVIKCGTTNHEWEYSNDLDKFKDDTLESVCYYITKYFETPEDMGADMYTTELSPNDLKVLLMDIPGEAG